MHALANGEASRIYVGLKVGLRENKAMWRISQARGTSRLGRYVRTTRLHMPTPGQGPSCFALASLALKIETGDRLQIEGRAIPSGLALDCRGVCLLNMFRMDRARVRDQRTVRSRMAVPGPADFVEGPTGPSTRRWWLARLIAMKRSKIDRIARLGRDSKFRFRKNRRFFVEGKARGKTRCGARHVPGGTWARR